MFEEIFIQKKLNKIEFKDTRFYPCAEVGHAGHYVPSSTTILDQYPKGPNFYAWLKRYGDEADTITAEALERGSKVHGLTELFDKDGKISFLDENTGALVPGYTKREIAMFHRYFNFSERYKPEHLAVEWAVGSGELGFGGTLDRVSVIENERWLFDIKTGAEYEYYWLQLASYKALWENFNPGVTIDRLGILYLNTQHRTEKYMQGVGWKMVEMPPSLTDKYAKHEPSKYWLWRFTKYLTEFQEINPEASPNSAFFNLTYEKTW